MLFCRVVRSCCSINRHNKVFRHFVIVLIFFSEETTMKRDRVSEPHHPAKVSKKSSMSLASTQERDAYSVVTQIVQEKLGSCTLELFCAYHKATRKINPQTLRYVDDLRAYIPADFWKCYAKASINPDKHKVDPQKALESDVEFDYFAFLGLMKA